MSSRVPSRAALRNAQLRAAFTEAFPGVRVKVRNGRDGHAWVEWVDGPARTQVGRVLEAVPSDQGTRPWAADRVRKVTVGLVAVGYLRARAAGEWFFREADEQERLRSSTICSWRTPHEGLAGGDAAAEELEAARVLVRLAELGMALDDVAQRESRVSCELAKALFEYGDVVDAVTLPTGRLTLSLRA